jgi:hypothetical protein
MTMEYQPNVRLSLRTHPVYNEKWLQQRLIEQPALLGLGDLDVKDVERSQPRAGRLDLLLFDPEAVARYEVEIQLGPTDESHIIRTLEYWDIERRRYPQYEHIAVIVAEEITARFFNVISLFNGFIPIVAIQVQAIEVGDAVTLVFTTVLDRTTLGIEEDDVADEPRDRKYWETKASPITLGTTDHLLRLIREEVEPAAELKYNKHYIGIAINGVATNFASFRPRRHHVVAEFRLPRSDEVSQMLEDSDLVVLPYESRWGHYRLQISTGDVDANVETLRELIRRARSAYGGPA